MNILLEIADKDLIIIALATTTVIILGIVIFYIANKNVKIRNIFFEEEEVKERPKAPLTEEQQKAKSELERVFNQMSADLETKSPRQTEIDEFERQQEENAIISYQELMRQAAEKEIEPINNIIKEEPKEKTKLENAIAEKKPEEKPKLEISIDEEPKKFKNSEIISPIFGIQNKETMQKVEYRKPEKQIVKHAYNEVESNFDKENNRDFLNSLKEFRRNL